MKRTLKISYLTSKRKEKHKIWLQYILNYDIFKTSIRISIDIFSFNSFGEIPSETNL